MGPCASGLCVFWRRRLTQRFGELSSLQDLGHASSAGVEVLRVVRAEIVAKAAGADREFVAVVAGPGVAALLGGRCRQGRSPRIGRAHAWYQDEKKVQYAVSQRKSPRSECFQENTPVTMDASSLMSTFW